MKKVELKFNDYVNENGECFTVIYNCYNKELAIETNGYPDCSEWCDIEDMLIDTPWEDEENWEEGEFPVYWNEGTKEIISVLNGNAKIEKHADNLEEVKEIIKSLYPEQEIIFE